MPSYRIARGSKLIIESGTTGSPNYSGLSFEISGLSYDTLGKAVNASSTPIANLWSGTALTDNRTQTFYGPTTFTQPLVAQQAISAGQLATFGQVVSYGSLSGLAGDISGVQTIAINNQNRLTTIEPKVTTLQNNESGVQNTVGSLQSSINTIGSNTARINSAKLASTGSSNGAVTASSDRFVQMTIDGTTGAYAQVFVWGGGADPMLYTPDGTQTSTGDLLFAKPYQIKLLGFVNLTSTTVKVRYFFTTSTGLSGGTPYALAGKGLGFEITRNSVSLINVKSYVHNGSTLTNVNVGTITNSSAFSVELRSDGLGNYTVYGNGSILGTGTGAPSANALGDNSHVIISLSDATGGSAQALYINGLTISW